jgi:type I restriction enzyme, R subunit
METPSFLEDHISQIPALQFLQNVGYIYLSPSEVDEQRGRISKVILEKILEQQLHRLNRFEFKGEQYPFSHNNIYRAIQALQEFSLTDGLITTNGKVYDLLTLGKSMEENIQGDVKSFTLRYIDWTNPLNNVFHVTEELAVERIGSTETYRPDLILFVNGIPFTIIECKSPNSRSPEGNKPVDQAILQQIRNQNLENGIPQLYIYSQLLLSISVNAAKYGTTGSKMEYWSEWKEQHESEAEREANHKTLFALKNKVLTGDQKNKLFATRFGYVRTYFDELERQPVQVTAQDELLYDLCRPERLIELTYKFIVYDEGQKKLPRYQQYFGVKKTLIRVKVLDNGRRKGGVIWHTQGSGKSLTMVMLAKCLALEANIDNPKIILVTDRVDLDDQIYKTFLNCGKEVTQAKTGKELVDLLNDSKDHIVTTVINKFETVIKSGKIPTKTRDTFILVDESHRTQYGRSYVNMQSIFKLGCYIAFTGTPLMKKDKNTAQRFGGIIDKYTIDQAVKDKAVVPLLYEGRQVLQTVNEGPIDTFFNKVSEPLTTYQKAELKKKFAKAEHLNEAEQRIYMCSWDISEHYKENWKGTGFKGQLACSSKLAAIQYKENFDQIGYVSADVIISAPDNREGSDDPYADPHDKVVKFWNSLMKQYGSEKEYNKQVINGFKNGERPEIIIVVDKLLTGFDAPRNTIFYLDKHLKEHGLLQAIARVNRVFEGKDFGYIIDYYGNLGNLDAALTTYSNLSEYDETDILGVLTDVSEEVKKLPERHAQLWDLFKTIQNKKDAEAFERLLKPKDIRDRFYDRLSLFARTLKIALSTVEFSETTPADLVAKYTEDAKFFLALRVSVKERYSDGIDYRKYEKQIQKLIDTHVSSEEVLKITELVDIFDKDAFEKEVEKHTGDAARADLIASRTAKTINEKVGEDPAFYKKFSKMLEEVIEEYSARRLSDAEYLRNVTEIMNAVRDRKDNDTPAPLQNNDSAKAFYGIASDSLRNVGSDTKAIQKTSVEAGLNIDSIIRKNRVVDWKMKSDVINKMKQDIDDYLCDVRDKTGLEISFDLIDQIIEKSIEVAKVRYE